MPIVIAASKEHDVPRDLVLAVIQVESSFRRRARSHAGARGLMQLMPRTAASLARRMGREDYQIDDPEFNINAGTVYLAYLLKLFDGDVRYALAGYNAGPARVRRWRRRGRPLSTPVARYASTVMAVRERFSDRGELVKPGARKATASANSGHPELDRQGLRALVRRQEEIYGKRPDVVLPEDISSSPGREDPTP